MALRQVADDVANEREEFDGTLIDVEALEAQHATRSAAPG
jgi:hypothetical protein